MHPPSLTGGTQRGGSVDAVSVRQQSKVGTRARLIEAGAELFRCQGIRQTSLEEVATAAGVHRVTLHRTFPGGRDELVAEVVLGRALEALASSLPSADDERSIGELITDAFTSFVMLGRRDPVLHEALQSDAVHLLLTPERLAVFYDSAMQWRATMTPSADRASLVFPHEPRRVTDMWARTVVTLVRDPGIVVDEDDVHAYIADFVIPGVVRSAV